MPSARALAIFVALAFAPLGGCGKCNDSTLHNSEFCIPTAPVDTEQRLYGFVRDTCASHLTGAANRDVNVDGATNDLSLRETICPGTTTADCVEHLGLCEIPSLQLAAYAITINGLATGQTARTGGHENSICSQLGP